MPNPRRGEVALHLAGRCYTLCLTLGALAELEARFGVEDLVALAGRFEGGRLSARDIAKIIETPEMKNFIVSQGAEPALMDPATFGAYIKTERVKWAKVIKAANVKIE